MNHHRVIGIDLGLAFSCVSAFNEAECRPETFQSPGAEPASELLPTIVSAGEGENILLGWAAKNRRRDDPESHLITLKDKLGRPEKIVIGKRSFSPQLINAMILAELKTIAETTIGSSVHDAVIAVPAHFTEIQRQATADAARIAQINPRLLINETTAAAICYSFVRRIDGESIFIVCDIGASGSTVSVISATGTMIEVLVTANNHLLSGSYADDRISEWLFSRLEQAYAKAGDLRSRVDLKARIKSAAEQAKVELSQADATRIDIPQVMPQEDAHFQMDRNEFVALLQEPQILAVGEKEPVSFLDGICLLILEALDEAGRNCARRFSRELTIQDVDYFLLVGGSTRIPAVKQTLESRFNKPVRFDPEIVENAVSKGAAIMARTFDPKDASGGSRVAVPKKKGDQKRRGKKVAATPDVADITCHTLGIGIANYVFYPLINKGAELPAGRTLDGIINADNQRTLKLAVYQGEDHEVSKNAFIGDLVIDDLEPRPEGFHTFEAAFTLDASGILEAEIKQFARGNTQLLRTFKTSLKSEGVARLNTEQIEEEQKALQRLLDTEAMASGSACGAELSAEQAEKDITSYDEKIKSLRADLEEEPASMALKAALAEALFRAATELSKHPVEALKRLNEAISIDPYRPAFHYHRGLQWHRLGNFERALSNYEHALHFDSGNPRIIHQIALAHSEAGRPEEAREKWKEAETLVNERYKAAKTGQKSENEKQGKEEKYRRALFVINCGRAEAALREGKPGEAIEMLKKVNPPTGCTSVVGQMVLSYLLVAGNAQTMREWLEEKLAPDERAKILDRLTPYLTAYQTEENGSFPLGLSPGPASRYIQILRALVAFDWARLNDQKPNGGESFIKQLREENPDSEPLLHVHLAFLHYKAKNLYDEENWSEAASTWRQALQSDPDNSFITLNLALTATRAKVEKDYERWWEKTLRLWYTRSFILPELEAYQNLIGEKHIAFASKAADLASRLQDPVEHIEALWLWVDEMERYFLYQQFSFQSPYFMLGVPLSAAGVVISEAYEAMKVKAERYSDATLSALKDGLKQARLEKLEEAYRATSADATNRPQNAAIEREESRRADKLRERKAAYLIAVSDHLKENCKNIPAEQGDNYARLANCLLTHPLKALERQFRDKGKADARRDAATQLRHSLAEYYFHHILDLLDKADDIESPECKQAKQLLEHLRNLKVSDWEPLIKLAQIEHQIGNPDNAVHAAERALQSCPPEYRKQLREILARIREGAQVDRYVKPALAHIKNREWASALELLRQAVKLRPEIQALRVYMANCYMGQEQWSNALNCLAAAERIDRKEAIVHVLRANCLLHITAEEIRSGRKPRLKKSFDNVRDALRAARNCPNAAGCEEQIKQMEQQLEQLDSQLN